MEFVVDGLTFISKFDSGNLAQVEKVINNPVEDSLEPGVSISGDKTMHFFLFKPVITAVSCS